MSIDFPRNYLLKFNGVVKTKFRSIKAPKSCKFSGLGQRVDEWLGGERALERERGRMRKREKERTRERGRKKVRGGEQRKCLRKRERDDLERE